MHKSYILISAICALLLASCGPGQTLGPTISESPAGTELAGIYEKTDVAATEQAKATPTIIPTPLGKSSGKILHTTLKIDNDETQDIFITNLDTLEKIQLTHSINEKTSYFNPSVSNDGKKSHIQKPLITARLIMTIPGG